MTFTSIPDPVGSRKRCARCQEMTVLVSTGTGTDRVHCGTYTARCHTTKSRRTT
jgi:ribosomal protein S27AE